MMVQRKGDWMAATVGEELVMMSVEKGTYLGLSAVGARIWELLEVPQDTAAICAILGAEFDVDAETCCTEVKAFLEDLAAKGAITLEPLPAA